MMAHRQRTKGRPLHDQWSAFRTVVRCDATMQDIPESFYASIQFFFRLRDCSFLVRSSRIDFLVLIVKLGSCGLQNTEKRGLQHCKRDSTNRLLFVISLALLVPSCMAKNFFGDVFRFLWFILKINHTTRKTSPQSRGRWYSSKRRRQLTL